MVWSDFFSCYFVASSHFREFTIEKSMYMSLTLCFFFCFAFLASCIFGTSTFSVTTFFYNLWKIIWLTNKSPYIFLILQVNRKTRNKAYDLLVEIGHACEDEERGGRKENLLQFFNLVIRACLTVKHLPIYFFWKILNYQCGW